MSPTQPGRSQRHTRAVPTCDMKKLPLSSSLTPVARSPVASVNLSSKKVLVVKCRGDIDQRNRFEHLCKFRRREAASCGDTFWDSLCYHSNMSDEEYRKRISIVPGVRSGKPCVTGTRMTVTDVLEYLAGGMSYEELLDDFPDLALEDILACLAFAAAREEKMAVLP